MSDTIFSVLKTFFSGRKYVCPLHGPVTQVIRLKGIGLADGLYCGKCLAVFLSQNLKKVEVGK